MNDPWAGIRSVCKYGFENIHRSYVLSLLAGADTLLTMSSYAVHDEACAIEGKNADEIDAEFCTCGYIKALAALPEYLREPSDGK